MEKLVVGVDVGTGSARAAVYDAGGRLLGRGDHPILMNRPQPHHAEQSSADIWAAVASSVRAALANAGAAADAVHGISFDATCSLAVLDPEGRPVSVSTTGEDRWDIIVWQDHRAVAEAEECTASRHRVLDYVGGVMSPEMEVPKLMWLKRNMPRSWARAGRFLDLADFLTHRASGSLARSACTVTCKWTYLAHERPGWQQDFLDTVGLGPAGERCAAPRPPPPSAPTSARSARGRGSPGPHHRLPRGCRPDRRPCRGFGRAGRLGTAERDRPRPPPRPHRRHLQLPHGALGRATRRTRRLGALSRRRPAGILAE